MAFDLPATQAFVAELVPREKIGAAVQLNQVIFHGTRLIGPAIAGWCVARYSIYSAFVVTVAAFARRRPIPSPTIDRCDESAPGRLYAGNGCDALL